MEFDEKTFLYAMTSRPEDVRRFMNTFRPEWLGDARFQPILAEVYNFTLKHTEPPSLPTLHKVFEDRDKDLYELRIKSPLNEIMAEKPDNSEILYTLNQAKNVAVVRSFIEMTRQPSFVEREVAYDGDTLMKEIQTWLTKFQKGGGDRTMDLKEAIENLIQSTPFDRTNERIPVGIPPVDDWTGKGLRRKQVGVFIAPTGHGKTAILNIIAHKIATIERKRVWFITNELSIEEVTERLMTRLSGIELEKIIDDPIIGFKGLKRHWNDGLQNRLWISEVNREVSVAELEAEMNAWVNLKGWKPDVIVLDYMERMKPIESGHRREKEWMWLGAIANDLVRMAKRHNLVIWSAAQTNRSGWATTGAISGDMAQGSIRHLQECTAVIGMNQQEIPGTKDVAIQFSSIKQRQSKRAPRPVALRADLAKMNITSEEIDLKDAQKAHMESLKADEEAAKTDETPVHDRKELSPREKQRRGWKQ